MSKIKHYINKFKQDFEYINKEITFINKNYKNYEFFVKKVLFLIYFINRKVFFRLYKRANLSIKNKFNLPFFINTSQVELEITTFCNMTCYQCNRSCRQAPSSENMSIEQIKYFIDESIKNGKKWKEIRLIGGEPSLHPDIFEICNLFIDYKLNFSPNTQIAIVTNGVGPKVKEILEKLPDIIHQDNSSKTTIVQTEFATYNVAPIDVEKYKSPDINYTRGCDIISNCGMALTRYGFYPCGAGASVDRIAGWDIGIKNFNEISEENFREQLKLLCKYCGHFKDKKDEIYDLKEISPTWEKFYQKYQEQKPELKLYTKNDN